MKDRIALAKEIALKNIDAFEERHKKADTLTPGLKTYISKIRKWNGGDNEIVIEIADQPKQFVRSETAPEPDIVKIEGEIVTFTTRKGIEVTGPVVKIIESHGKKYKAIKMNDKLYYKQV